MGRKVGAKRASPWKKPAWALLLVGISFAIAALATPALADGPVPQAVPLWSKVVGTSGYDYATEVAVAGQMVIVAGNAQPLGDQAGTPTNMGFVRAYSLDGSELWSYQFSAGAKASIAAMVVTEDGIYVAGSAQGVFADEQPPINSTTYVAFISFNGEFLWAQTYDEPGFAGATDLARYGSTLYVLESGGWNVTLRAVSLSLDTQWRVLISDNSYAWGRAVAAGEGGVVVVGTSYPRYYGEEQWKAWCFNADGSARWNRTDDSWNSHMGSYGNAVAATDSGFVIGGRVIPYNGGTDAFVAMVTWNGSLEWEQAYAPAYNTLVNDVAVDGREVVAAGSAYEYGSNVGQFRAQGFDLKGAARWTLNSSTVSPAAMSAGAVAVGGGGIFVAGYFTGGADANGFGLDALGGGDGFVMRIGTPPVAALNATPNVLVSGEEITLDACASTDREDVLGELQFHFAIEGNGVWGLDWGDACSATVASAAAGDFTARVQVRDRNGGLAEANANFTVVPPLTASIDGKPPRGHAPFSATLRARSTGGLAPLTYAWTVDENVSAGAGPTLNWTFWDPGYYEVAISLVVSDSMGRSARANVTAIVDAPALVVYDIVASPPTGTAPLMVRFAVGVSGGRPPVAIAWNFRDGAVASGSEVEHEFARPGMYLVYVSVTETGNPQATNRSVAVNVSAPPLSVSLAASPEDALAGENVGFTAQIHGGIGPYVWEWDFGDGAQPGHSAANHAFGVPATYIVRVTVKDDLAQRAASAVQVRVRPQPLAASFAPIEVPGASPLEVTYRANASGGQAPYSYLWSFGDGASAVTPTATHRYGEAGEYLVTLSVYDSMGLLATSIQMARVWQPLTVTILAEPVNGEAPLSFYYRASVEGGFGNMVYAWTFGDGDSSRDASGPHLYETPGNYTVWLEVEDDAGAMATASVLVVVSAPTAVPLLVDVTPAPPPPAAPAVRVDTSAPLWALLMLGAAAGGAAVLMYRKTRAWP